MIYITSNYRHSLYIEVVYTNCLANSLNIFIDKTPVPSSGVLFAHPFINKKPYYNSGLSLNRSIYLTSIDL